MTDIRTAVNNASLDLREEAQKLANQTTISDDDFIIFSNLFGDLKWLPFELPKQFTQSDILNWQNGRFLPQQQSRHNFVNHVIEYTHPSLL